MSQVPNLLQLLRIHSNTSARLRPSATSPGVVGRWSAETNVSGLLVEDISSASSVCNNFDQELRHELSAAGVGMRMGCPRPPRPVPLGAQAHVSLTAAAWAQMPTARDRAAFTCLVHVTKEPIFVRSSPPPPHPPPFPQGRFCKECWNDGCLPGGRAGGA